MANRPQLKRSMRFNCKKCNKEYELFITEHNLATDDYAKHCSRICANSKPHSDESKLKLSLFMTEKSKNTPKIRHTKLCTICGHAFLVKDKKIKTCSKQCTGKQISKAVKGKTGGYRAQSGTSKFHGSWYCGAWMDSSWELAIAKRLDFLNVKWKKEDRYFQYTDINGEQRKYYPDFWLPEYEFHIEVKGYWTDKIRHKILNVISNHDISLFVLDSLSDINNFTVPQYKIDQLQKAS